MRELTRSMASFSWAMSLFGVEQMANLISPRRAADAFGAVARSAQGTLGPGLRSAFQTGDRLQGAMIDFSFGLVGLGPSRNGNGGATAAPTAGSGPATGTAGSGASGLLSQVGNLAFGLIQMGIDTVYNATGTAWQQQKGLSGWGPVPPPNTNAQP
jgi:hypothetical protein